MELSSLLEALINPHDRISVLPSVDLPPLTLACTMLSEDRASSVA